MLLQSESCAVADAQTSGRSRRGKRACEAGHVARMLTMNAGDGRQRHAAQAASSSDAGSNIACAMHRISLGGIGKCEEAGGEP